MPQHIGLDVRLTYYTGGGIAKYIRRLASDLPALAPQHRFTHLYRRKHTTCFSPVARRVDCWTPAHHRFERWALALEVAPHRFDLLHSPDFIPPGWGFRRSVITVHDLTFLHYPEFLTTDSRRYYNGQIADAVRRANAISADSYATQIDLVNLLGVAPNKITVIHLGLDPEFCVLPETTVDSVLQALNLTRGYLLFVGTFEPRKNVPGLLRSYALLRQRFPDAPPLVLVGRRGWLFAETMALIQALKLEPRVRLLEELPNADLPAVYNGASLCVLPSHYEGFGFPVLEAMGCGVPTVIANRASLPEIAGEAALAIEPDDAEQLADALYRALTTSALRTELRAKGFEQIKKFTWAATAAQTLALYQRVLEEG